MWLKIKRHSCFELARVFGERGNEKSRTTVDAAVQDQA
jgi:hypothetical protein